MQPEAFSPVLTETHDASHPVLELQAVSFGYGTPIVRDVSLAVSARTIVGLLGPNGAGKTTVLRLLAGLLTPDAGHARLEGRPLTSLAPRDIARRIAVVPQDTEPAFEYSVLDMVLMGRHPHLSTFEFEGPEDLAIARDAMAATNVAQFESRPFSSLSGGEKQRVIIAGALAQSTRVLLLDEPTASLDLKHQLETAALLKRLRDSLGVTIVLTTHDLNVAAGVCDTLVLLSDGCVLAQGPTESVLTPDRIIQLYDVADGLHIDVHRHPTSGRLIVSPGPGRSSGA